ncbi:MAG: hypothetical protein IPK19_25445 [Chloroflexi bacterium]|nr:hypothetical protein [Chloroflexota bacterium]
MDEQLHKLIACIFDQHADSNPIDCETCGLHFHHLADLVARGASVNQLLPEVQQHLDCCPECNEEFQALMSIIIAENRGLVTPE